VTASGKMRDINACAFTSIAFHPKAECCLIDLAGLLACSLLSTFPLIKSTVVWRFNSRKSSPDNDRDVSREFFSRFTSHNSRKELTATGIAPDLHRTSLLICLIILCQAAMMRLYNFFVYFVSR